MLKRWIMDKLLLALQNRRGVYLTGARQSGKTTLTSMLNFPNCVHRSLDIESQMDQATLEPDLFVRRKVGECMVIDEIQKLPRLLSEIKINLDHDDSCGQYLLTGSANLRFVKKVRDSLAGRLGHIRLRTLALGEMRQIRPTFFEHAFKMDWKSQYNPLTKAEIINLTSVGGYPEPYKRGALISRDWYDNYLDDLIDRDIQDIAEIRKTKVLHEIAVLMIAHSAQFISIQELAQKCGIARQTAEAYLETLKAAFIFDSVDAWTKSDYDRIGKKAKWLVSDPGIMTNILRWNPGEVYMDGKLNGKLIETWAYHELASQAEATGHYEITYYRDSEKREIDFLVERDDGALLGIEIKGGQVARGDFNHLRWFAENLAKHRRFLGIVLYTGEEAIRYGENLYAVPMAAFGEE